MSKECKSVVDRHGQTLVHLLLAEAEPKTICSQVGMCTFDGIRGISMGIEKVVNEKNNVRPSSACDAMCDACETVVVWMQNQLRQNQTAERSLEYVNELCDRIPRPNRLSSVDCESLSSMAIVSFAIGGQMFELSPHEFEEGDQALCISGFTALDLSPPQRPLWIF